MMRSSVIMCNDHNGRVLLIIGYFLPAKFFLVVSLFHEATIFDGVQSQDTRRFHIHKLIHRREIVRVMSKRTTGLTVYIFFITTMIDFWRI